MNSNNQMLNNVSCGNRTTISVFSLARINAVALKSKNGTGSEIQNERFIL